MTQLSAQTPLESLKTGYAQRREALEVKRDLDEVNLRKSYHNALEGLMGVAQEQGDFTRFVEIENELKRTKNTLLPVKIKSQDEALGKLQGILEVQLKTLDREEAASLVDLHGKLDKALVQLQQVRLREGDVNKAKEIENLRAEYRREKKVAAAYDLAPTPVEAISPSAGPVTNNTLALQKLKGRVMSHNMRTGAVEILYDFSDKDQLKDFSIKDNKAFRIVENQLVVTAPKGSDWFPHLPEMRCPWLTIPYLELEDFEMEIEILSLDAKSNFHLAWGVSNLKQKTLGMGPFSMNKSPEFRIEGWTPKQDILRKKLLPGAYPAVFMLERKGKDLEFGIKTGSKTERFEVEIGNEMPFVGMFPKAWGGEEATAVFDNLRVKGRFKPEGL